MSFSVLKVSKLILRGVRCRSALANRSRGSRRFSVSGRYFVHDKRADHDDYNRIRNIGIMAHIDAGKTTTTERMLYYSGLTNHMGDVDAGDTVMDYMEQERNRGITINSAAITFLWNHHKINLIDTPGHVDFTVEVERALRVLDGAVAVLDASAGVEAQTVTVWRQADRYHVPRIAFLNKMDKPGASYEASIQSMRNKLKAVPLPVHVPVGEGKDFSGVIDLLSMEKMTWKNNSDGKRFTKTKLTETSDGALWDAATAGRNFLIEQLADLDDVIADLVLSDVTDIDAETLESALRNVTLTRRGIPVLCGSSLKNKGVQPLMDAVNSFLPNPTERTHAFVEYYGDKLCALAFKIVNDKRRGLLTYLRLYSGSVKVGDTIFNVNRAQSERITKIFQVKADEYKDLQTASAGNIVLVSGLKQTITGDTIVSSLLAASRAKKAFLLSDHKHSEAEHLRGDEEGEEHEEDDGIDEVERIADVPFLAAMQVPDPVFMCTIEPPSLAYQLDLEKALTVLQREDPSLRVKYDEDSGQTILSGMGELHLEIVQDRIKKEFGVDSYLGPLQISYKETPTIEKTETVHLDRQIGNTRHVVTVTLSVHPSPDSGTPKSVAVMKTNENTFDHLKWRHLKAINTGMRTGLMQGPALGFPVIDVTVQLHSFQMKYGTSLAMVSAAVSDCLHKALKNTSCVLLEPYMLLQVSTDEAYLGTVINDLSQRRSNIRDIHVSGDARTVVAMTPLSELLGYATTLRTKTSGTAHFTMEVDKYEPMNEHDQLKAIERVTGFLPS